MKVVWFLALASTLILQMIPAFVKVDKTWQPWNKMCWKVMQSSHLFLNSSGLFKLSSELAKYGQKVDYKFYSNGLSGYTAIDEEPLQKALQQMFSEPADPKSEGLKLTMEEYIKYKKRYVKHLQFNPNLTNLSECFISSNSVVKVIHFQLL